MVVRFEVDARLATTVMDVLHMTDPPSASSKTTKLSSGGQGSSRLTVLSGGSVVPQSSLIELKAASYKNAKRPKWSDVYPQLCLSQTPWLYRGIHHDGEFTSVEKKSLTSPELTIFAERAVSAMAKLHQALRVIKDIVVAGGPEGRLSLVLEDRQLKVFRRRDEASCLPAEVIARFQ